MNIDKQLSQLIFPAIRLNEIPKDDSSKIDQIISDLKKYQWGGYILFDGEATFAADLVEKLQSNSEIPLFICSDLERGAGQHFKGATKIPSNMAIAATNNFDNAFKAGKITAEESKEIGINVVFSPVVDVNNNPQNPIINIRSYGEDPQLVADMAQAFIYGCQSEGVLATAKHFPGHGNTATDSHENLPVINKNLKALEKIEIHPYRELIKDNLKSVMAGHISVPALDPEIIPAIISPKIINHYLREVLGFDGIVFTDALNMGGAKQENTNIFEQSIKAGCDVLLMPDNPIEVFEELVAKIVNDESLKISVQDSYDRIQKIKAEFAFTKPGKKFKRLSSDKNTNFTKQACYQAITSVKQQKSLPLDSTKENILHIIIDLDDNDLIWSNYKSSLEDNYKITSLVFNTKYEKETLNQLKDTYKNYDVVLVSFFSKILAWKKNIFPDKNLIKLLEEINQKKSVIYVTYSNPYLIKKIKFIQDYFCTFSDLPDSQDAIIDTLFKDFKPQGVSPVKL